MSKDENISKTVESGEYKSPDVPKRDIVIPAANKPGIEVEGADPAVEITFDPTDRPMGIKDMEDLLTNWGYDPKYYELVEPIKISQWNQKDKETGDLISLYSYKGSVRTRRASADTDYEELVDQIKKHKKHQSNDLPGEDTIVICVADTQIGKSDGDGTKGTIKRFMEAIDDSEKRIKELRKMGRPVNKAVIAFMGDLIENCEQSYAAQAYTVEWNRRQQIRIVRRLARNLIATVARLVDEVDIVAVPGNHGENKSGHRVFTTPGDNDDVGVIESVADMFAFNNEAYGHINWHIPEDEIYVVLDVNGHLVCFAHGHVTSGGNSPQKKQRDWWEDQAFGGTIAGACNFLITAHYHHFSLIEHSDGRTHFQCPTLESESTWWLNLKGEKSPPGVLTFVLTEHGYQDVQVVPCL